VVAVCGWGDDEPLEALVAAAAGSAWRLTLTGRPRRPLPHGGNVRLAGFLDDRAYHALLAAADLIVVLTERDDTLLSGAWEALAHGRPLLVSATSSLRATFGDEVARAGSTAESIRACIDDALADEERVPRVLALAERFRRDNDAALRLLAAKLGVTPVDAGAAEAAP
jgi:glycosyltransferase involved in cell wall biosynthesis